MNHADDDQVQRLKTRKSDTFGPPGTYNAMVKFITRGDTLRVTFLMSSLSLDSRV